MISGTFGFRSAGIAIHFSYKRKVFFERIDRCSVTLSCADKPKTEGTPLGVPSVLAGAGEKDENADVSPVAKHRAVLRRGSKNEGVKKVCNFFNTRRLFLVGKALPTFCRYQSVKFHSITLQKRKRLRQSPGFCLVEAENFFQKSSSFIDNGGTLPIG